MSDYPPAHDTSNQANEPESKTAKTTAVLTPVVADPSQPDETATKQPRSRKVWFWGILTVLLLGGGFIGWRLFSSRADPAAAQAPPPTAVKVETISSGQIRSTAGFVGTLEAQERVSLQPQIQGRIERVLVASGDRVTQGTPIVELSLDQTQADVGNAIAGVNSNQAALATAKAEFEAKQADRTKAASDVKLQQVQFNRTQGLVKEGVQVRQQLDIARNNVETLSNVPPKSIVQSPTSQDSTLLIANAYTDQTLPTLS